MEATKKNAPLGGGKTSARKIKGSIVNLIACVALYALFAGLMLTGAINSYITGILTVILINIILTTSLNLTTGFLGQLALGHAGFMSIGAYTAAIFTKACPDMPLMVSLVIGLILGGLMAGLVGLIVGIPALRLKGDYLAIVTLGFGEIIRVVIENLSITGGAQGLRSIPKPSAFAMFTLTFIVMVLCLVILFTFIRSRHGRAVMAIREDPIAAEACGVRVTFYRTFAFTLSAVLAGVAGGLYAHYIGILGAKNFGFMRSVEIVVMVVLGGMGSFTGSTLSTIVLTALPEGLREFSEYRMLVYSIVLIVMMIFKPSGLLGGYEFSLTRAWNTLKTRLRKKKNNQADVATEDAARVKNGETFALPKTAKRLPKGEQKKGGERE